MLQLSVHQLAHSHCCKFPACIQYYTAQRKVYGGFRAAAATLQCPLYPAVHPAGLGACLRLALVTVSIVPKSSVHAPDSMQPWLDIFFPCSAMHAVQASQILLQALLAPAVALYRCYREGTNYMRLYEMQSSSPYLYLMPVLIAALKIWYRLDGAPTPSQHGMPACPHWMQWAEAALHRLQGPIYPPPGQQVCSALLPHCLYPCARLGEQGLTFARLGCDSTLAFML